MKAFTTASALLGLLPSPAMATEAVKSQAELSVGGVTFKLSRFHDGRVTPYRLYFWDEEITGSSYRFGRGGHLEYFKAGSEVYYDRMETDDGKLTFKSKEAVESRDRAEKDDKMVMHQELPDCTDCTADLAAVCDLGLPMFCDQMEWSSLDHDGAYSAEIVCKAYESLCDILHAGCVEICIGELEYSELTRSNIFVSSTQHHR